MASSPGASSTWRPSWTSSPCPVSCSETLKYFPSPAAASGSVRCTAWGLALMRIIPIPPSMFVARLARNRPEDTASLRSGTKDWETRSDQAVCESTC